MNLFKYLLVLTMTAGIALSADNTSSPDSDTSSSGSEVATTNEPCNSDAASQGTVDRANADCEGQAEQGN